MAKVTKTHRRTSGFVYIWRDRKHNRYYIGSHWGPEDDGYLCSSNWMRDAYKRRPEDFKRRVIARGYTTRLDLYAEENRWLQLIKPEELRTKYYNLHLVANHWTASEKDKLTIGQKISKSNKGRKVWNKGISLEEAFGAEKAAELRKESGKGNIGRSPPNKGKSMEELFGPEKAAEIRERQRKAKLGKKSTPESREKCRQSMLKYRQNQCVAKSVGRSDTIV